MQISYTITAILTVYAILTLLVHAKAFAKSEAVTFYAIVGSLLWPVASIMWCWYSIEKLLKRWGVEKNNPHKIEYSSLLRLYLKTVQTGRLAETALADISDYAVRVKGGWADPNKLTDYIQKRLTEYIEARENIDKPVTKSTTPAMPPEVIEKNI